MPLNVDIQLLKVRLITAAEKLQHTKPEFRYCIGAFAIGYLLTFISPLYEFFSLSSNQIFNFQLWKLITSPFFEPNILVIIYQIIIAYQFVHLIEPVWGQAESLKFITIVQLITPLCIAILALFEFIIFGSFYFFYYGNINGMASIGSAILVAIKQFLPDVVLLPTPFGRIKNNHLPALSIACFFVLWVFGMVRGTVILQVALGIQIGWTYLRFYQAQHETNEIGDHSEHFAWATMFPRRTQATATIIGRIVFRILARFKICKRVEYTGFEQYVVPVPVDVVLPTAETRDAERRRQKALRDLNERLGRTPQNTELTDVVTSGNNFASDNSRHPDTYRDDSQMPSTPKSGNALSNLTNSIEPSINSNS